jgi:FixJ family two-component response regulator
MRAGVEFVGDLSIERRAGGVLVKTPVISIVDDDESVREGTLDLVRSMGLIGEAFPLATAFLTSERLHATSCLIADMRMPGMTGLELYNRLVQSGNRIPTILITAFPEDYARKRALRDGVICYLPKPFDARELLACIRLALGQPQAGDRQS